MTPRSFALGLSAFIVVGAAISDTPASAASTIYRVTPILPKGFPTQQFGSVIPTAINASGVVVGWQVQGLNGLTPTGTTSQTVGFTWNGTTTRASSGLWNSINDSNLCGGYAIGSGGAAATNISAIAADCLSSPIGGIVMLSSNPLAMTMTKIPSATQQGIPQVLSINASGQFVGQQAIRISGGRPILCTRAFAVTTPNVVQDLGALPNGCFSAATWINTSGAFVGWSDSTTTPNATHHAVRWQGATPVDIGTLGGAQSEAAAITDGGITVGSAQTAQGSWHLAAWAAGSTQPRDLGTLGGAESRAIAIFGNRVLGKSQTANGTWHAVIYDLDANKLSDVNDLLPANSGWVLNEAHAMNSRGTIVGVGMLNNATTAFALSSMTAPPLNTASNEPKLPKPIILAPH